MSIANEQISLNEVQLSETNPSESEAEVLTLKIKSLVVFNQSITEQHTVPNAIEESVKFYVKLNTNEQGDVENWRNYLMDLFQQ